MQSSTVKSYVSAIKRILIDDGYEWNDNKILLNALTKACRLINDRVQTRLPIHCGLLELLLFEIHRHFMTGRENQIYLTVLYQVIFALGYYGLMRVGELTLSQHTLKAKDVHLSYNKEKLLMVLYSSKTHDRHTYPQEIKIIANKINKKAIKCHAERNFCPFVLIGNYIALRDENIEDTEPFFIFRDGSPVMLAQARRLLKQLLSNLGLNEKLYDMHSLRIGRCSDMVNKLGFSIEEAKRLGWWKSSCVFRYIRNR